MKYDYDVFEHLVLSFYVLEGLVSDLAPRVKPHLFPGVHGLPDCYPHNIAASRLLETMNRYREWFHRRLARTLRDSLAGMILGEARYTNERDVSKGPYFIDGYDFDGLTKGQARKQVFRDLESYSLKDVSKVHAPFENQNWHGGGYGGEPWAKLVETVEKYPKTDKTIYCDTVFHAVHNGGCAFNKGLLVSASSNDNVKLILDIKFNGDVLRAGDLHWFTITPKVYGFWAEACKLYNTIGLPSLNDCGEWVQEFQCGARDPKLKKIVWSTNGSRLTVQYDNSNCGCEMASCKWCAPLFHKEITLNKDAEVTSHGEEKQVEQEQEQISSGSIVYSIEKMPLRKSVGG